MCCTHVIIGPVHAPANIACDPDILSSTNQGCRLDLLTPPSEMGMQEMKRALFVYAKLNPGIKYVQGMNEIYAPIYYQFATDTDAVAAQHAEGDAFFCFVELISEFRDHFCQHLVRTARQ